VTLTFDPVTLTIHREHLQCITYDVMKLCTKFERNRAIRTEVILRFQYLTQWPWTPCNVLQLALR